jgi:hypothetical protein
VAGNVAEGVGVTRALAERYNEIQIPQRVTYRKLTRQTERRKERPRSA